VINFPVKVSKGKEECKKLSSIVLEGKHNSGSLERGGGKNSTGGK
jgi:hypothetical protein